jgi:hypothetical protein
VALRAGWPLLFLAVLLAVGCSSSKKGGDAQAPGVADHLHEVATLLRSYGGQSGRGPGKPADLARYESGAPLGYLAVKSGEIIIVPGATMPGEGEKSGTEAIVAYEKNAPTAGGYVLLHNGTVKQMTAAEFQAAPKAK